ncbi:unnamed protein product [Closterium sp. Yama58-4]|nr:unnamed protein product [Closterium sp. Yama58-4]
MALQGLRVTAFTGSSIDFLSESGNSYPVIAPHELVAVRGVVQASGSGYHGWRRLGFGGGDFHVLQRFGLGWRLDPLLLPEHGVKQACAIVERTETILNTNLLYGWLTGPDRYSILFRKSIPFSLAETTHPSAPRVDISLEGVTQPLPLHTVFSHVHKTHPSWGSAVLHVLIGKDLLLGLRTDERVLPINHDLTAVGHVRFGSNGRPAIFASPKLPYFLISDTKEGMLQRLNREWRMLLGWCLFLSAAAVGLVGFALWREASHVRALAASTLELERSLAHISGDGDADEEVVGEEVQSGERCVVCLHRKRKAVFVPCGHRVCCVSCSRVVRVEQLPCPICRGQILAAFRV